MSTETFSSQEIAEAQAALDLYPDSCPFWDAAQGQEVLYVARRCKLTATTTNLQRRERYAAFVRKCMKAA